MYGYVCTLYFNSEKHIPLEDLRCLEDTLKSIGMTGVHFKASCEYNTPFVPLDFFPACGEPMQLAPSDDLLTTPSTEDPVEVEPVAEPVPEPAPVTVDKATLKAKLFQLRDLLGSDAVEAVYEAAGNGAVSLNKLDPDLYQAVFDAAEAKINELVP